MRKSTEQICRKTEVTGHWPASYLLLFFYCINTCNFIKYLATPEQKSLTILLADDDPDDCELLQTAFSFVDTKLYLHTVEDGISALDYMNHLQQEEFPCLIILDYNMPKMNGLEVLQQLKMNGSFEQVPKIILTTAANNEFKKLCMENGADKYLVKPRTYSELVSIARDLIEWCTAGTA
jgi:CheY-like chemotaxis protein